MAILDAVTKVETPPEGDWITPGGEMDDIEVLTKGYTDAYTDAQAQRHLRAAQAYGGDVSRVPNAILRKHNLDCLLKHCVSGVRNLKRANGEEITFEDVKVMVYEPQYRPLADGLFAATRLATLRRKTDLEELEGNSAASSASS
jgi:hypothetical protein